jgi:hypothetical protein
MGTLIVLIGFAILQLLINKLATMPAWLIGGWAETLSKDHRDDPVYKKNVEALIERSRQFEIERNRKFETKQ